MPRTLEARRVNAYTISKLAGDAGISIHRVRQYEQRGLLRPCQCTDSGYHLYDEHALSGFTTKRRSTSCARSSRARSGCSTSGTAPS